MAEAEKVATGFRSTEGPVFSRRGYLLFSDVPANRIMRWEKGAVSVFRENSNGARGLTFDHQGRLLACERNRVTRTEKDGRIVSLAAAKGPRDVVYAIDGSIYFSDPAAGGVYQIPRGGTVRAVARDCEKPGGVALAPNQQRLYVADTAHANIRVYDVAPDGTLRNGRVFGGAPGVAGGLKTDEAGDVWAAGPAGVLHFDPEGRFVKAIAIPEAAGNLNWGAGFRDLYLTAQSSVYKLATRAPGTRTY